MFAKKSSARARDLASDGALASGWLMKRGERNSAFKRRFSVLRHTATFAYFKGDGESVPLGAVDANNYVAVSSDASRAGSALCCTAAQHPLPRLAAVASPSPSPAFLLACVTS